MRVHVLLNLSNELGKSGKYTLLRSNLIWRTVSCRVDEVIPSDPIVWPHP